jgi:hypothetical protein
MDRCSPEVDCLTENRGRSLRVDQRNERDRQQTLVVLAEVDDGVVVRSATGVQQVLVLAHELRGGERREHELTVEPEEIEHVASLGRIERAHGAPALVLPQPLLGLGPDGRAGVARLGACRRAVEQRLHHAHRAAVQLLDHVGRHEAFEEPRQLHQVAVRVEHGATIRVCH